MTIDLSASYLKAVTDALPHVVVVADRFHLVSLANQMVTRGYLPLAGAVRQHGTRAVRGRRGRKADPEWAARRKLLTAHERLSPAAFARMWNALVDAGDPGIEILHACVVKEQLRALLALVGTDPDREQGRRDSARRGTVILEGLDASRPSPAARGVVRSFTDRRSARARSPRGCTRHHLTASAPYGIQARRWAWATPPRGCPAEGGLQCEAEQGGQAMRIRAALGVLGALALMATPLAASAVTPAAGAGLWPSDYQATTSDCGSFSRDANGFCDVYDSGSVELGVKFTTSQSVLATGVRVYRVDGGTISGSLWKADGGPALASGSSPAASSTPGWQDLAFTTPVPLVPGTTYIASYFAPNADYAAENFFFADKELTVGPITALQSVEANRNGVYCYDAATCFPSDSFRDSNYWVTPLWAYGFDGFYQPIDVGMWNTAQAGRAIPVRFSLNGDHGLAILQSGFPRATQIACDFSAAADAVEETTTATSSSLRYDPTTDQYVYVLKSVKDWANKCYRFELGLIDGTSHSIDMRFTK